MVLSSRQDSTGITHRIRQGTMPDRGCQKSDTFLVIATFLVIGLLNDAKTVVSLNCLDDRDLY